MAMTRATFVRRAILCGVLLLPAACTSSSPKSDGTNPGTPSQADKPQGETAPPPDVTAGREQPKADEPENTSPIALAPEICKSLRSSPAAGLVRVTLDEPDCSGIGNIQRLFEVVYVANGGNLATLYHSEPLIGPSRPRVEVGDLFIASIEPKKMPAERVYCVQVPKRDGYVREFAPVADEDEGRELLRAVLGSDRECAEPHRE